MKSLSHEIKKMILVDCWYQRLRIYRLSILKANFDYKVLNIMPEIKNILKSGYWDPTEEGLKKFI